MTIKKMHYLIIGNSAGGIGAAEAIREIDTKNTIVIVSDEPYLAYSRPLISEYLARPRPVEDILYRTPAFYEDNKIQTILGDAVVKIDPAAHTVTLASGQALQWRKLLLATGGTPIVPVMEGGDLNGVFTFNTLDNSRAIDEFLSRQRGKVNTIVIGGGLIGVSVTEALTRRGVKVTIIEMKDRILNAMLDEKASGIEAEALGEAGIRIITNHTAVKINSRLPGEASGVTLDDGRVLYAQMVIVAIGVRPRTEAVEGSGIKVNRGIIVDRRMATSAPDVYACGDASEAYDYVYRENRLTPVWPNAFEGGRVAGLNMAGHKAAYHGGTAMNAMKYFERHIVSAGMFAAPDDSYETLLHENDGNYRKVITKDGRITGLIFAGDIEKSGIVYNLMKDGADVSAYHDVLVADEFGLASLPEETWRPRLTKHSEKETVIPIPEEPEEAIIGD